MNPSDSGSGRIDPFGFNFNASSVPRPPHPPGGKGLRKPKMVKLRKHSGSAALKPGASGSGPEFNPFRVSVSGSGVVEGMSKLGIGSEGIGIEEGMKKLGIGGGVRGNDEGNSGLSGFDNVGRKNVGVGLGEELERKLNISGGRNDAGVGRNEGIALPDQIRQLDINDAADGAWVGSEGSVKDGVCFGSKESSRGYDGAERESVLIKEMEEKFNVGSAGAESTSGIVGENVDGGKRDEVKFPEFSGIGSAGFVFQAGKSAGNEQHGRVFVGQPRGGAETSAIGGSSSSISSSARAFFSARLEKGDGFSFTSKQPSVGSPFMEFNNQKGNVFLGLNQRTEHTVKSKEMKTKKKRGKMKQPTKVHIWPEADFVSMESAFQEIPEASESYSPMDISPYREAVDDNQFSRENSVASQESYNLDKQFISTERNVTDLNDIIDEDLLVATQRMDINEDVAKCANTEEEGSDHFIGDAIGTEIPPEESISGAETESFKSANEEIDFSSDFVVSSGENEASSSSCIDRQDSDTRIQFYSCRSIDDFNGSSFTFAASSSTQESPVRNQKKNRSKVVQESYAPSSFLFTPSMGASMPSSPSMPNKADLSTPLSTVADNSELLREQEQKKPVEFVPEASVEAQEACEKWRLRGNQAYKNGDLTRAEDYYTQGVDCISKSETSRSCLRAQVLCYSNRAATRMSLGRMRDALEDCKLAATIDPNFLRVQLRAANCCLALGEVEGASEYFRKCLQLGSDACVDRKIAVEASEGLQMAQKLSESLQCSAKLLESRTSSNAECALQVIAEALSISPCSERLLRMKAECLLLLRRYDEVILLCEQSLGSAEKNSPLLSADNHLENEGLRQRMDLSFRIWRSFLIVKSYFHLGRLEEAIGFLEKQEGFNFEASSTGNCGGVEKSLASLASTVHDLIHHKGAGNEAFQAGKHSEAIEHYTTALSRTVESRPFSAICFCNRAAAYKSLGQITDAIADCNLAIALDGNYLKAISRRATLYEMIRDYGQAATDLQRLIAVLTKLLDEKTSHSGQSLINLANDLKQARLQLSMMEEEAKKEIPPDMYLILGVESSASTAEIKKAYRKAALRHHPDKASQSLAKGEGGDDRLWKEIGEEVYKDADRLFKMIGEAYAVLSDPTKRSQYDLEEEKRNAQKKRGGNSAYRTYAEAQHFPSERSGSRRQWREVWRSHARF